MSEGNVHPLPRRGGIPPERLSVAAIVAAVGIVVSAGASIWYGGLQAGRLQDRLDQVTQRQQEENALVQQQYSTMNTTLNTLNVTIAGLTVEMKNLQSAIEQERQDRLSFEQQELRRYSNYKGGVK